MRRIILFLIFCPLLAFGQASEDKPNVFVQNQYPSGVIQSEGLMVDGEKEGLWIYYFVDGAVRSEKNYSNGLLHGSELWFHPNGQVGWQEYYVHGAAHGVFSYFDSSGNLTLKKHYVAGVEQPRYKGLLLSSN